MKLRKPTLIEPAAIWSLARVCFDDEISLTQNVILYHGQSALLALVQRIGRLTELLAQSTIVGGLYSHPEIPQTLTEIFTHQGVASSILFDSSDRGKDESARALKLRRERVEYVGKYCSEAGLTITALSDRSMRNRLIHMDEYVEKALRRPNTGWFVDTALQERTTFGPPHGVSIGYCRCFIASEGTLVHLGREASLANLLNEAVALLAVVFGVEPSIATTSSARAG